MNKSFVSTMIVMWVFFIIQFIQFLGGEIDLISSTVLFVVLSILLVLFEIKRNE